MANIEKTYYVNGRRYTMYQMVEKGIANCLLTSSEEEYEAQCADCPYYYPDVDCGSCKQELRKDALALLKEHEELIRLINKLEKRYGKVTITECGWEA